MGDNIDRMVHYYSICKQYGYPYIRAIVRKDVDTLAKRIYTLTNTGDYTVFPDFISKEESEVIAKRVLDIFHEGE